MGRNVRLTMPLLKQDGVLRPAGWSEALSAAASGLDRVRKEHGGSAFGLFSCSKATNETNYLAQKFSRAVMGSSNVDSCNRT